MRPDFVFQMVLGPNQIIQDVLLFCQMKLRVNLLRYIMKSLPKDPNKSNFLNLLFTARGSLYDAPDKLFWIQYFYNCSPHSSNHIRLLQVS